MTESLVREVLVRQSTDLIIAKLEPACRMLAEARDAPEAKKVADLARAAEVYARRQKLGDDAIAYATAVRVDAMAMMGEFLKTTNPNGAENTKREFSGGKLCGRKKTLPEGVTPKESSDAQALADIKATDPALFEEVRSGEVVVKKARQAATAARQERARRKSTTTQRPSHTPDLPSDVYRCIVCDPPWPMKKSERAPRPEQGPELTYRTLKLPEIEALPVRGRADPEGCHLYLWVTHRFLPDGLRLMATWGFTYHCLLTWVKPSGMTPYSWMFNTEHVLFGYSGKFAAGKQGLKVSFDAPAGRGKHSTKPDVFFERVREFSAGPRLEMFARSPHEGFKGWGNEFRD